MAEPGYEHENMFSRIGRTVFGAPDRDVKPGTVLAVRRTSARS